ncbi:MAG: holo-ACP synthase [Mariprofundaceae bacterium]|nr:holo-ACP synthase [Mariprofundaceae bacterium]
MIFGIGTDRVVIDRIAHSLARFDQRFVQRIYTKSEYKHACKHQNKARRLAMMFAAKEATVKAIGTGFVGDIRPRDVEVDYLESGQPILHLHAGVAEAAQARGISQMHLSLSDDGGVAIAFVVAEKDLI